MGLLRPEVSLDNMLLGVLLCKVFTGRLWLSTKER